MDIQQLLEKVHQTRSYDDGTDIDAYLDALDEDDWDLVMKPFLLRGTDLDKLHNSQKLFVIEPQDYTKVVPLTFQSELHQLLEDSLKGLPRTSAVTTGDGPGHGDKWYKVSPKLKTVLKKYIKYYSKPKKGMLRTLSLTQRFHCLENMNHFRASGAPKASATYFRIGHIAKSKNNGQNFKVVKHGSTRKWVKI